MCKRHTQALTRYKSLQNPIVLEAHCCMAWLYLGLSTRLDNQCFYHLYLTFYLSLLYKKKNSCLTISRLKGFRMQFSSPKNPSTLQSQTLSTSPAVYVTSNLTALMYKLSPFVLFQNWHPNVYKTQNIEGNSRWPEIPFWSLGGADLIRRWIEFLKIFWINSLMKEGCGLKLHCWLFFIKTLNSPVKNLNTIPSLHFKGTCIHF